MNKIVFSLILIIIGYYSFSQNESSRGENISNIIKGVIAIGENIDHDIKLKQSRNRLDEMRRNHNPDVDCWYIDGNGSLKQDLNVECWIDGVYYGSMSCSACKYKESALKAQYVDLGLPSGTLWKIKNEEGGLYTYDEATSKFWGKLPTKEQMEELRSCQMNITNNGIEFIGPNSKSIFSPVTGCYSCDGDFVDEAGSFWSSTSENSNYVWIFFFLKYDWGVGSNVSQERKCNRFSVRLVK